jgi:hypothetical protein
MGTSRGVWRRLTAVETAKFTWLWLTVIVADVAFADDFRLGDTGVIGSADVQLSSGVRVRTQAQSVHLIDKLNLAGQQGFCDDKNGGINCTTVAGNAAFLQLPGAASANNDNGDLNYDKGGLVDGTFKISPRVQLTYGDLGLDVSGLYFYDGVNNGFNEYHPNNFNNNGFQPEHTTRSSDSNQEIGSHLELQNAYLSGSLPFIDDHGLKFKIGNLVLNQGQSTFLVLNSLNDVNPPDINIASLPGADLREVFKPVPLAVLQTALTSDLTVQAFYQFLWQAAPLPPEGSYFSSLDPLGDGGTYAEIGFGKNREDPNDLVGAESRTPGESSLLSRSGRTQMRAPDHDPDGAGEYGIATNYFVPELNETTFGLYYRNLHSRLPIFSTYAAAASCAENSTNAADATIACRGFASVPGGLEPIPVDTARYFVEYPKDIHSIGANFSTSLGAVSWSGEVVYRVNQPLQVDPLDVGFAGLQPAFPKQTISFAVVDIPSNRVAAPDYLYTQYLKQTVQPYELLHGYVRRPTFNYETSLLYVGGASDNPFGASSVSTLLEFGAFQIVDLPSLDQLQIAGPGTQTHHSAGIDGSGTPNAQQQATTAADRQNPTSQTKGFATDFSYGMRSLVSLQYDDVFRGVNLTPTLAYFQDIGGTAPVPSGEYISGRKQVIAQLQLNYFDKFFGGVNYTWYFGGGDFNQMRDRGNISVFTGAQF